MKKCLGVGEYLVYNLHSMEAPCKLLEGVANCTDVLISEHQASGCVLF